MQLVERVDSVNLELELFKEKLFTPFNEIGVGKVNQDGNLIRRKERGDQGQTCGLYQETFC